MVTGATGGLGRILVSRLAADGRDVMATGRNVEVGHALSARGSRFIAADLAHDDLAPIVEGAETVFHLAALSAPFGPDAAFVAANVHATRRILDAAARAGVRRFVFTSSPSIYAQPRDCLQIDEATPVPPPANAYARTKREAEQLTLAADAPGFACIALRPRAILSPFDTALLPRLRRAASRGVLPLPAGGRAWIEPTDARDVVDALLAAERHADRGRGRAFNVSGGLAIPLRALVERVFANLGERPRILAVPRGLALGVGYGLERIARVAGKGEPALTAYGAMILGWSQTFDLSATREILSWTPQRDPLAAVDWAVSERIACAKS